MIEYHETIYENADGDIKFDQWKEVTWKGTTIKFTMDTTDEDIIEWMEENINKFQYDRLREMMNYDSERSNNDCRGLD